MVLLVQTLVMDLAARSTTTVEAQMLIAVRTVAPNSEHVASIVFTLSKIGLLNLSLRRN
jgi:hypothetical protein